MNTWEHIFDEIIHEINPQTLKTRSAKSNISFAKKYCKTMPPKLIATCLQSVQQALSFSVIHPDQKTKTILDILDALPFIFHLAHHTVTTATAAEERSATLCFLLTRALATEENIFDNGTTVIGQDHTPVEQAIRNGYITYRADQRSRQAAPQRVVASVNSIIPTLPLTFAQSDRLEEWFTRFDLWDAKVVAIVWCVAMVCSSDPGAQREGYFLYLLHLWAQRRDNQQTRRQHPVERFLSFSPKSDRWITLDAYETRYIKLYTHF